MNLKITGEKPTHRWTLMNTLRYCMGQMVFICFIFMLGFAFPHRLLFNVILIDYIFYKRAVQ